MNGTQTLERALDIVFALAEAETTLTVSEIAEKVAIPESTAYRLLKTLETNGIIERKLVGQIGLGMRILDLARSLYQQIDRELFLIARPIMEKLTELTNETTLLCVRTGTQAICVQHVETRRMIRFSIDNGKVLPMHRGASGKVILAFEHQRVVDQILRTIDGPREQEQLVIELESIRKLGYSLTLGEVDHDVFGLAVPVYDSYQRVIASLTVAGPADRLPKEETEKLAEPVILAAKEISEKMARVSHASLI